MIYLGKFHHDLTVLSNPGIMVSKGNHPQMAQQFRLVKYYNLPRYIILPQVVENPAVGERGWREAYLDTGEQPIELVLCHIVSCESFSTKSHQISSLAR